MSLRLAIGGFMHESHSFAPHPADYEAFLTPAGFPHLSVGDEMFEALDNTSVAAAGMIARARAANERALQRRPKVSGGNGQVYRTTTNPSIATGDGVAMVYRAKGRIENMEFIQFHPTALYEPGVRGQSFLITEAVRGDGGILRNHKGEAFMERYDERKDLAPRDIVARAIDNEMKINGTEHVYLDCRHFTKEKFVEHFPNIYEKCLSIGVDITKDMIPVAPAAHYSCGGIKTDEWARTSVKNLYAAGECASTGLHGANRLASSVALLAPVRSLPRFGSTEEDLKRLFTRWSGAGKIWQWTRQRFEDGSMPEAQRGTKSSKHLARLWAKDEVERRVVARQRDEAVRIAARHQLVTSVSGAVVLESKQQFDEAGLKAADPLTAPTVPEPGVTALLALGAVVALVRARRSRATAGRD